MNWLKIAGGLTGLCLLTAFVWVIIGATYDEAYRIGFAAGRKKLSTDDEKVINI